MSDARIRRLERESPEAAARARCRVGEHFYGSSKVCAKSFGLEVRRCLVPACSHCGSTCERNPGGPYAHVEERREALSLWPASLMKVGLVHQQALDMIARMAHAAYGSSGLDPADIEPGE